MANWFHAHAAAAAAAPMGGAGTPQGQTAKPVWSTNRIATALWELFGTLVQNENETAYITTSQRTSHAIWCDSSNGNSAAPFSAPKVWFCRPQAIARSWLIWLHRTAQYEVVVLLPHRHGFSTQRSKLKLPRPCLPDGCCETCGYLLFRVVSWHVLCRLVKCRPILLLKLAWTVWFVLSPELGQLSNGRSVEKDFEIGNHLCVCVCDISIYTYYVCVCIYIYITVYNSKLCLFIYMSACVCVCACQLLC